MNVKEAVSYIEESVKRGSILGLSRMKKLLDYMGNPQEEIRVIHVAGTNGKGSTVNFLANILTKSGYKTGMYYSPALEGVKDHYRIDGKLISDEDYAKCVSYIKDIIDKYFYGNGDTDIPTQFEIETALAYYYMKLKKCDFAVIETGLGGRDDATNICNDKELCIITSISMDHMDILGNSIYEIARCKAGIIKGDYPVVAFNSSEEVVKAINEEADIYGSEVIIVDTPILKDENVISIDDLDIRVQLQGKYQLDNAYVAIQAANVLKRKGYTITDKSIKEGIETAKWPYRFERISDELEIYLDGAHNDSAANRLRETIASDFKGKTIILVMGMFKDKEYEKVIATLAPLATSIYAITTLNENRTLKAEIIKEVADKHCKHVVACRSIKEAANLSKEELGKYEAAAIIACGSLSYLAEYKKEVLER